MVQHLDLSEFTRLDEKLRHLDIPWAGLPDIEMQPGSVKGLHLVVGDINEAHEALFGQGVEVGVDEEHDQGIKYAAFSDPDGNIWTLQEMQWRSSEL